MVKNFPQIMQSQLTDDWYIVTKRNKKENGLNIAHIKYPISKEALKQIAYDWLIKEANGCERGYTFEITDVRKNETFKITVEIIKEGE